MKSEYHFKRDELPDFLTEPLDFVSVLSHSDNLHSTILQEKSHYITCKGVSALASLVSTLENLHPPYFCAVATDKDNSLRWDSRQPKTFKLKLHEHTFNHNAYVGRYIDFKTRKPLPSAPELSTFFEATVTYEQIQTHRDLLLTIENAFRTASVTIVSDIPLAEALAPFGSVENKSGSLESLFRMRQLSARSCLPTSVDSALLQEDMGQELYEYLCLCHMNAVPNSKDSHVRASVMYMHPDYIKTETALWFQYSFLNVSPTVFYNLAKNKKVISILTKAANESVLTFSLDELYTWHTKR